jgi:uncharacterized protein (DUF4415 family)
MRSCAKKEWIECHTLGKPERRHQARDEHMPETNHARASEIRALKRLKDKEIDTTDIPPVLDWSKAVAGKFYRPIKKPLTLRVDADVLASPKGQNRK